MASADDLLLFMLKLNPDAQARMLLSEQGLEIATEIKCSIKCVQQIIVCIWIYCC